MSHITEIETEVHDLDSLAQACTTLGLELVRGQTTYKWYGRSVGDTPLPKGFTEQDLGKCEHAIRIPGDNRAYEIGVARARNGEGYTLLWDSWRGGFGMEAKVGDNAQNLTQQYLNQVAVNHYQLEGFQLSTDMTEDGSLVLRATRYS